MWNGVVADLNKINEKTSDPVIVINTACRLLQE